MGGSSVGLSLLEAVIWHYFRKKVITLTERIDRPGVRLNERNGDFASTIKSPKVQTWDRVGQGASEGSVRFPKATEEHPT